jgi:hypothetical protein
MSKAEGLVCPGEPFRRLPTCKRSSGLPQARGSPRICEMSQAVRACSSSEPGTGAAPPMSLGTKRKHRNILNK